MFFVYNLTPFFKLFCLKSNSIFLKSNDRFKNRKINNLCLLKKKKNYFFKITNHHFFSSILFNNSIFFFFFSKKLSYISHLYKRNFFSIFRLFFLHFSFNLRKTKIFFRLRKFFLLLHFFRNDFRFLKKRFKYFKRFKYYTHRNFYVRRKRFFKYYYVLRYLFYERKNRRYKGLFKFLSYRYNIFSFSAKFLKKKILFFFNFLKKNRVFSFLFLCFLKRFRFDVLKNFFFTLNIFIVKFRLKLKTFFDFSVLHFLSMNKFFRKLKTVITNSKMCSKRLFFRFLLKRRYNYREKNKRLFKISYQLDPRFYLIDEFFFNSFFVSKFITNLVKSGKKAWARRLVYSLFAFLKYEFKMEIIFLFMRLLSSVLFPYALVKMHRGRSIIESPVLLLASQVVTRTLFVINMNLNNLTTGSLLFKYFTIFNDYFFLQQGFLFSKMSDYIVKVDDLRFLTLRKYSYRLLKNFI